MDILTDDAVVRLFRVLRRYLPAIYGIILSVPVLFYLLVVRSATKELIYSFRILNSTEFHFYEIHVKSDHEFRCAVAPGGESETFIMKMSRDWFQNQKLSIAVRHRRDSALENQSESPLIFYVADRIMPDKVNRICIKPDVQADAFAIRIE